ncbi:methyl-accepting chemotaxis protein [Neosynechococcus sphagnicola]|uniref:methyl-accepting chemotaxis protein n=1 Tax=Neosynechococcus sphagnicola TaxID=1501145 RepID=UPI00068D9F05|nr:methyl-accepting chemotaxis protein [Neosynechococcus sphagnicola]
MKIPPTQLPYLAKIDEAAQVALQRSPEVYLEPIVVVYEHQTLGLLDLHLLLQAQSHILNLVNAVVQQQKLEAQQYSAKLREEQTKVHEYTRLLEAHQSEIQGHNQLLELQKSELVKQSQEISLLNQKFIQIAQLLSLEGTKAFQATFDGVDSICANTSQIVDIGQALDKELETVQGTSKLIERVSKQVQYLAVQAAVVANQTTNQSGSGQIGGFSFITTEIGKLVTQTFEAGNQVNQIANRFRIRIKQLTDSAQEGAAIARSLIEKIERAEVALSQLEELVGHEELGGGVPISLKAPGDTSTPELNPDRLEPQSPSRQADLSRRQEVLSLIQKIEQKHQRTTRI